MSGSKFIARKVAVVTRVARCTCWDLRNSSCRRRPAQPCCVASLPLGATSTSPSDDDIMQGLLNQAQHSPMVTSQQDAQSSSRQAAHERSSRRATAISGSEQPSDTASCVIQDSVIEEPETVGSGRSSRCQTLASHLPLAARGAPASMDFHAMCSQLAQWRATHLTAHVPRHVFDAPALGAWVRHMRKLHKDGKLEQWKVEVLNALGFVWHLSDQDARWHHLYHQLRRYKLLHGSTTLDPAHSAADGVEWDAVARWLEKQARMLAKQRLSPVRHAMLAQLDVTLRVPRRLIVRTARLQALNGPERRMLRKRWKRLDAESARARAEARVAALDAEREQAARCGAQDLRRLELLQEQQQGLHGRSAPLPLLLSELGALTDEQLALMGDTSSPFDQHAGAGTVAGQQPLPQSEQQQQQHCQQPCEQPLFYRRNRRQQRLASRSRQEACWTAASQLLQPPNSGASSR